MNEQELKLYNQIKKELNRPLKKYENCLDTFLIISIKDCKILINLIDKQQKLIKILEGGE